MFSVIFIYIFQKIMNQLFPHKLSNWNQLYNNKLFKMKTQNSCFGNFDNVLLTKLTNFTSFFHQTATFQLFVIVNYLQFKFHFLPHHTHMNEKIPYISRITGFGNRPSANKTYRTERQRRIISSFLTFSMSFTKTQTPALELFYAFSSSTLSW